MLNFHVITLFPEALQAYLEVSILGRAQKEKKIKISYYNPRDYAESVGQKIEGKLDYKRTDAKPYGGGPGMVMLAEPVLKAVSVIKQKVKQAPKMRYFLLELDIAGEKLSIASYKKDQEKQAIIDYAASEKKNSGKREYDVVLVGADTSTDLKKAYPNYFVDSEEFLTNLKKIINKY